ncbi:kinase-like domain-containing protein [Gautieria morchelliformis]|nr:kinase-like domain-containing protein [Gautieria morchelliformis]
MTVPNQFVGKRISNNSIELLSILGEGSYGCVYRAIMHQNGTPLPCAVKCLSKSNLDAYHLLCQRREVILHKQVSDGKGIVSLYAAFEDSDYQWIVLEYSPDGDLWEGISDGIYAGEDDIIRDVFDQILAAVEYCHSKHVFHRDLKPENVLLADKGRKVLLADFGLASGSPVSSELRCGSPRFMSPECWGGILHTNQPYATAPNDIWCLGVLLVNLACSRQVPWKHATSQDAFFSDFVRQPGMLRFFLPLSTQVHDLLSRVFELTPSSRISIRDFRIAISKITSFAIPTDKRNEFHDNQRAVWSTALGPTSSRPLSTDIIRIAQITKSSPIPAREEDGVDITDAAKDHGKLVVKKASHAFSCYIPIIETSPEALGPCLLPTPALRTSSNSLFPVAPQIVRTRPTSPKTSGRVRCHCTLPKYSASI